MVTYGLKQGLLHQEFNAVTFSGTNAYLSGKMQVAGNFLVAGSLTTSGAGRVASVGSTATYGAFIQAGSLSTSAGSIGAIVFGVPYAAGKYYIALSPLPTAVGSTPAFVSGTLRASGCSVIGGPSSDYSWISVGL